ncbi:diguanylate cyclase domain-containing protein [Hirschia litorea]|uniref:Diguanylate cyclase domain-containing protein n=1 Tax=Hirschia litorea TaxID=1199156 RepID=A0ABW2IHN6_9PROT
MTRPRYSAPLRVSVVCGDHGRAQYICNALKRAQLDARVGEFTEPCDVFLFDLSTCRPALVTEISRYAKECSASPPLIATLGAVGSLIEPIQNVDVRLSSDSAISLANARFHFARRTAARRAEVKLRKESYERFGFTHSPNDTQCKSNILYVGEACGRFLALKGHLESQEFNISAAFSTHTAFDFLHDHSFSAILLDTSADRINPDNFCAMVRRSSNLVDIPILALADEKQEFGPDILDCVTDLIDTNSTLDNVSDQLTELIQNRGPSTKDFAAPNKEITDAATGLFTRAFFENHLEHQIEWSLNYNQALTLLIIKVEAFPGKDVDPRDLSITARVVKNLLRVQDAPTRLDWSTLAVSMPGADEISAKNAARRLEGVLDATAFEGELGQPARQIRINWHISELNPDQSPEQLLSSALKNTPKSGYAAA